MTASGASTSPATRRRTIAFPQPRLTVGLVALALLCTAVLAWRAYDSYPRMRLRPVTPTEDGTTGRIGIDLPGLVSLTEGPVSTVLFFENPTDGAIDLTIRVNDVAVATRRIVPGAARVDLRLEDGFRATANHIDLEGTPGPWSLERLEIGNAYGFSSGAFELVVAPSGASGYRAPGLLTVVATLALLLFVAYRPPAGFRHRVTRVAHGVLAGLVVLVLVAVLLLPSFTIYEVLLANQAFWICLAVLYAPALAAARRHAQPIVVPRVRQGLGWSVRHRHAILYAVVIGLFLSLIWTLRDPVTGFTRFIMFGAEFEDTALPVLRDVPHDVRDQWGYDGQFYAQLALEPLARDPALDVAVDNLMYRAQRILFAWTAYVGGLGQPAWILQVYALQNVVCWVALALLLMRWLPPVSMRNVWLWSACLFSDGLVSSVTRALLEGPSLVLLTLTIIAIEQKRTTLATALAALSGLGRQTNLVGAAVLVRRLPRTVAEAARLMLQGAVLVVPVAAWALVVRSMHPDLELNVGGENFGWPLTAWAADWVSAVRTVSVNGWQDLARFDVLALTSVTVQAGALLIWRRWHEPWYRAGVAYVGLMTILGPAVWEGSPGAFTRVLLPMTFAFNILLPGSRWFWPLAVAGNLWVVRSLVMLEFPFLWTTL